VFFDVPLRRLLLCLRSKTEKPDWPNVYPTGNGHVFTALDILIFNIQVVNIQTAKRNHPSTTTSDLYEQKGTKI
jgi:hypothetical protein